MTADQELASLRRDRTLLDFLLASCSYLELGPPEGAIYRWSVDDDGRQRIPLREYLERRQRGETVPDVIPPDPMTDDELEDKSC